MEKADELRITTFAHKDTNQLMHLVYVNRGGGEQHEKDFREQYPGFLRVGSKTLRSVVIKGQIQTELPTEAQK